MLGPGTVRHLRTRLCIFRTAAAIRFFLSLRDGLLMNTTSRGCTPVSLMKYSWLYCALYPVWNRCVSSVAVMGLSMMPWSPLNWMPVCRLKELKDFLQPGKSTEPQAMRRQLLRVFWQGLMLCSMFRKRNHWCSKDLKLISECL